MIGQADDVAGIGLVGDGALLGEEELRRVERDGLAGAPQPRLHAARKPARADAQEGDAVAMVGIHVRLDLEDEAAHGGLVRRDRALLGRARLRRRRIGRQALDQVAHAEIAERAAEQNRRQVALAERGEVEGARSRLGQRDLLGDRLALALRQAVGERRGVQLGDRLGAAIVVETVDGVLLQVVDAGEAAAHAERPGERRRVERQPLLDLLEQLEGMAAVAVELVDEGDDGDVAQAADLEQLQRARLDAAGRVDHHDGGIDRGQRAVGVLGEVLVAGRVEQVEDRVRHTRRSSPR